MRQKVILLLVVLSLLLSGCSWLDGSYVSVTRHRTQTSSIPNEAISAADYTQLYGVLEDMIAAGTESGIINVAEYDQEIVGNSMDIAVRYVKDNYPIGAYAVEDITYELGANSGMPAIAVTISYRHSSMEIQMIQTVQDMEEASAAVGEALAGCHPNVVLHVQEYKELDFSQLVQDYAQEHPETVMEIPQVSAGIYGSGSARVMELTFSYQTSRDFLRSMKAQVQPVFESAALYVSGEGADSQKYAQLYAFLMERFEYTLETSITPAYSLLRHGVGDSRAFAMVYASMCRMAGLDCMTVTGTRNGEPHTWNIVLDDENYFHVDLLRSTEMGGFREFTDDEMSGYVWDYSTYPECPAIYSPIEEVSPSETVPQPTEPEQTQETIEPTEIIEATLPPQTTEAAEPPTEPTENLE